LASPNDKNSLYDARPLLRQDDLSRGGAGQQKGLRGKFCGKPWEQFEVQSSGNVWVCCPSWLDTPIGNCLTHGIEEVWNSHTAQEIRRSILDGSFRYCKHEECPLIQSDSLPDRGAVADARERRIIDEGIVASQELPSFFNFCHDESCNLSCPSCRKTAIWLTEGPEFEVRQRIHRIVTAWLFGKPHDQCIRVNITGSGDPFASRIFFDLLTTLDGRDFPNVTFDLQTNGVMFTPKYWAKMSKLHGNIGKVIVSFDAATAATYAYTRRGGNWEQLLKNMCFLDDLRRDGKIRGLRIDFVVQQRNYQEMIGIVELGRIFSHVDVVAFSLITDWGTYAPADFQHHAIWKRDHPEFPAFLEVLRHPIFADRKVFLGTLSEYRRAALSPSAPPPPRVPFLARLRRRR
jgi:MoaA/NifB/PqqE/SkfB family radical SAM enzyme